MPARLSPRLAAVLTALTLLLSARDSHADWPQWRGPRANAAVAAGGYPVSFSESENVVWRVDLPGPGSSTPIVVGDAIYVTCDSQGQDTLGCYGLDGEERWTRRLGPAREGKHRNATGANSSPVSDGERVFAYFKSGLLAALTHEGEELWRHNLQEEIAKDTLWWDLGTSPIVTEAGVLVAVIQEGDAYLVTFDLATGEIVWKEPRPFDRPTESDQSYTTPAVVETANGPCVVVWGADHLTGHDPATGRQVFVSGGFNPENKGMWRSIASTTIAGGMIVTPFGRGEHLAAVRLGGEGDITRSHRAWTLTGVGSDVPCPAVAGDRVYVLGDKGAVTAVDLQSGDKLWSDRLPRSKSKYFSSPLVAGDLMYCFREDGVGYTVRVGDAFELLSTNDLGDETVATPVPVGDGRLLVRTRERLYLFGEE